MPTLARARLHTFSNETTIHGFRELDQSKKWWQKLIWLMLICASTTCFVLQARLQLEQYFSTQRTSMIVKTLSITHENGGYVFPRVVVAVPEWLWIDEQKLIAYNVTYEELAAAKTFLANGEKYRPFTSTSIEEAKEQLRRKVHEMNASDVLEFFDKLAYDNAVGIQHHPDQFSNNLSAWAAAPVVLEKLYLDDTCYYVLNTNYARKTSFGQSWATTFVFDFVKFRQSVDDYLKSHRANLQFVIAGSEKNAQKKNADGNKTDQQQPQQQQAGGAPELMTTIVRDNFRPWLQNDDFSGQVFLQRGYLYAVHYTIRLFSRRLSPCNSEFNGDPLYNQDACVLACAAQANATLNASSCFEYSLGASHYYRVHPLCSKGALNGSGHVIGRDQIVNRQLNDDETRKRDAEDDACVQRRCLPACEQWLSTSSFIATEAVWDGVPDKADTSTIQIFYPDPHAVQVTEEVVNYKWHDLISDIGGLLGLWLGASMMSIFQVVHLCLCNARHRKSGFDLELGRKTSLCTLATPKQTMIAFSISKPK